MVNRWMTAVLALCIFIAIVVVTACSGSEQAPSNGTLGQAVSGDPSGSVAAQDALQYVGSRKTVCGNVESPTYARGSSGQPTFLNLDNPYPNQIFTVVIWGRNRDNFPDAPEQMFSARRICATGLIQTYRGVPQIEATDSSQVRIVDE